VILSESGLVTLTGGKWTTFRKMGEDTVEYFTKVTGEKLNESKSLDMKIHGATNRVPAGHWGIYGFNAKPIQDLIKEKKEWEAKLHPDFPNIEAEVIWAVREEMAMKVEDVLARRIRMLFLDAQAAMDSAPKVALLMAEEMGKDEKWIASQLADFHKTASKYLIKK